MSGKVNAKIFEAVIRSSFFKGHPDIDRLADPRLYRAMEDAHLSLSNVHKATPCATLSAQDEIKRLQHAVNATTARVKYNIDKALAQIMANPMLQRADDSTKAKFNTFQTRLSADRASIDEVLMAMKNLLSNPRNAGKMTPEKIRHVSRVTHTEVNPFTNPDANSRVDAGTFEAVVRAAFYEGHPEIDRLSNPAIYNAMEGALLNLLNAHIDILLGAPYDSDQIARLQHAVNATTARVKYNLDKALAQIMTDPSFHRAEDMLRNKLTLFYARLSVDHVCIDHALLAMKDLLLKIRNTDSIAM